VPELSVRGAHITANQEAIVAAQEAVSAILDKKGEDPAILDVSDLIVVTDLFVIATGTSRPHLRTLVEEIEGQLKTHGRRPLRREGVEYGKWVLLDYGDFVVHLFDDETRDLYDLERLWADAPRVAVSETSAAAGP
jgi:ribosome-associated protein